MDHCAVWVSFICAGTADQPQVLLALIYNSDTLAQNSQSVLFIVMAAMADRKRESAAMSDNTVENYDDVTMYGLSPEKAITFDGGVMRDTTAEALSD